MSDEPRINVPKLRQAILAHIASGKTSRRALSMTASEGKNPDMVRDIFRVDKRMPQFDTVAALAKAMGREISDFVAGAVASPRPGAVIALKVCGTVKAGAWLEAVNWPEPDCYTEEFPHDGIEGLRIGLEVDGRSMDRRFPPGTILDCVKLIGSAEELEDGDYVIVERQRSGLVETTCKRVDILADGSFALVGESSLPEFEAPIFTGSPDLLFDGDDEIRVVARVVHSRQSFLRRRKPPAR